MRNGIQSFYLSLGNEACFFLQILNIAEKVTGKKIDIETASLMCSVKGYIYLNWDNLKDKENFLIIKHKDILESLTPYKWEYEKVSSSYVPKKNEFVINEYKNGSYIHFDSVDFHSLQNSETVKNGKIISKRVFRQK